MRGLRTVACLISLLGGSLVAWADNTTCENAIFVMPDASPHDGELTAALQFRWYRFVARANRSYTIVLENMSPSDTNRLMGMGVPRVGACGGPTVPGVSSTQTFEPVAMDGDFTTGVGAVRYSFEVNTDTSLFFTPHNNIIGGGGPGKFRVRVVDTTLFSPRWSTLGGFFTSWAFQNTTDASCSVTLRVLGATPAVPPATFAVAGESVVFRDSRPSDLNVPASQRGNVIATHNCPPGAIQADAFIINATGTVINPAKFESVHQSAY
jgi:hypothetical protein